MAAITADERAFIVRRVDKILEMDGLDVEYHCIVFTWDVEEGREGVVLSRDDIAEKFPEIEFDKSTHDHLLIIVMKDDKVYKAEVKVRRYVVSDTGLN